ncbi:hypothetical protein K2173_001119 [Erythroxylum novogranatense]|uniref:Protein ORGANELLE TRANSCRIPT PROCESSING 51 n=1 Tax=Erythroxylum novogranatense TaxID=1862640 RepID=A0AAV8TKB5_9ROSI|nr:hypothetical protein K2173_001119 [Erythroxylum novogranatense]
MLLLRAEELSTSTLISVYNHRSPLPTTHAQASFSFPWRTSLSSPISLLCTHHSLILRSFRNSTSTHQRFGLLRGLYSHSTFFEQVASEELDSANGCDDSENEAFKFEGGQGIVGSGLSGDLKNLNLPELEVIELEELPEQWRRSRLAWLCKELPAHKAGTLVRILNAQRKWMRQDDATYVIVHCMRIRENEAAFRVYKWMMQQHWYRFDFALATKLADYMGKEQKFAKCREIYDDIINQGRVPSESTFHILIVAYLSAPVEGCREEACSIYNRMIQLGGYLPRLSLHNALFRALVSKPGGTSKYYLKQAEFIYHNLVTTGLEVQKDIYGGLIWLHSYQDIVDKARIGMLREEMKRHGVGDSSEVLVSILRACSKEGDVEESQKTWLRLLQLDDRLPSQAFVYRMEVFAKVREPMRSLDIFREMQERLGSASVAAYHKIIEVLCEAQEVELAESLMREFVEKNLKPLMPSYIDLMSMYLNLNLHDKLQSIFTECLEKCQPNRTIYNIYLDSFVKIGNLGKAEEIFNHMCSGEAVGFNTRSCNIILSGYLSSGQYVKAVKIYRLMCQKKYDIESSLMEKLDYVLKSSSEEIKKPIRPKLSKEQREILVGLLLGGLEIESDDRRKKHMLHFEFSENSGAQSVLKRHLHDLYYEWIHPSCRPSDDSDEIPYRFYTIMHTLFGFYANQFWPNGRPAVPKLIHRWLSNRVLAYWYMYGGHRTSSGDILLTLKGHKEGLESVVKTLQARSLDFRVRKKGRVFWIGFLGSNSACFWNVVEPYILEDLKRFLRPSDQLMENNGAENPNRDFNSGSNFDGEESEGSDIHN